MEDLGVDYVIEGGQSMNPSIEDIEKAIKEVPSKNVFVMQIIKIYFLQQIKL